MKTKNNQQDASEIGEKFGYTARLKQDLRASIATTATNYAFAAFMLGFGLHNAFKPDPNLTASLISFFSTIPLTGVASTGLAFGIETAEELRAAKSKHEQTETKVEEIEIGQ